MKDQFSSIWNWPEGKHCRQLIWLKRSLSHEVMESRTILREMSCSCTAWSIRLLSFVGLEEMADPCEKNGSFNLDCLLSLCFKLDWFLSLYFNLDWFILKLQKQNVRQEWGNGGKWADREVGTSQANFVPEKYVHEVTSWKILLQGWLLELWKQVEREN